MEIYIKSLIEYALAKKLITPADKYVAQNRILEIMQQDSFVPHQGELLIELEDILKGLLDCAVEKGIIDDNIVARDLFDAKIMGALVPMPREINAAFDEKYDHSPKEATDYYYKLSQDTDYIRTYRIKKDLRWKYSCQYGDLDITINLSKPEKDPKAIAALKNVPALDYPHCHLCAENEGYAGRMNHPARQNHRILPVKIGGEDWYWQYSPYVYYNEHCIVFNSEHTPMNVNKSTVEKLFDFTDYLPHYFIGSNSGLPIVGGSILSHEHYQGGKYEFAMNNAKDEIYLQFNGFSEVTASILHWPLSVIRLRSKDRSRLSALAGIIFDTWSGYNDDSAQIYSHTDGTPHNAITPIARINNGQYELDIVLRNNITTKEHPMGLYHPHEHLHNIKKENIGLIEVLGLAVLPGRLKAEMKLVKNAVLSNADLSVNDNTVKHAAWMKEILSRRTVTADNIDSVIEEEIGRTFVEILECAGVFKCNSEGREAFLRFVDTVNTKLI